MPRWPKYSVYYLVSLIKDVKKMVNTPDRRVRALPWDRPDHNWTRQMFSKSKQWTSKIFTIFIEESWKKSMRAGNWIRQFLSARRGREEMRKEKHDTITSIPGKKKKKWSNIITLLVSSTWEQEVSSLHHSLVMNKAHLISFHSNITERSS